jgi:hypothetical protein
MAKDWREQAFPSERRASKERFLFFRDADDLGEVEQVSLRRDQRLPGLADWPQAKGCKGRPSKFAGSFRNEMEQPFLIKLM